MDATQLVAEMKRCADEGIYFDICPEDARELYDFIQELVVNARGAG